MPAAVAFVLITLPWLNPFSPGPTAQTMPLLFAWICTAGVLLALALDPQRGENQRMLRAMTLAWGTAATLSAVIGLLQYFELTASFGVWLNHTEAGQAFGNLRQRNQFATLLNIGLATAVWLACQSTAQFAGMESRSRLGFFVALGLAAVVSMANAASSSRTGMFQLVLVVALALGWLRNRHQATRPQTRRVLAVLFTALAVYAVATLVLPLLAGLDPSTSSALARLRAGDAACSSRLTLWRNVLFLIAQKPYFGWGWGELDYAHFITLYTGLRFCDILDNAHNLPLQLAVELGVPLAVLTCGTAVWLILRAKPWCEHEPARQLAWAVLAVILLHSLLEYPLWYGPFQAAAALSVWLLVGTPPNRSSASFMDTFRHRVVYFYALAATFLVAYCSLAAWNYYLASQIYLDINERATAYRDNTLEKVKGVWLYQDVVRFAALTTTDLTVQNAAYLNALAKDMLHFSPEARVAELVVESALLLGRTDEAAFYTARYQAAFPQAFADWRQGQATH